MDDALTDLLAEIEGSQLPPPSERRRIRVLAGVSIRQSAALNEVSAMTYLRWERGDVTPRRARAVRYRQYLDALRDVKGS